MPFEDVNGFEPRGWKAVRGTQDRYGHAAVVEKIGAIALYNTAVDNLCGAYHNIATMGRAYLDTLSPMSD